MQEFNRELQEMYISSLRRKELIKRMRVLMQRRFNLENEKQKAKLKMQKEEADVSEMQGRGIWKHLQYLAGNYDERLEMHILEADEARAQYHAVCRELDTVMNELNEIDKQIAAVENSDIAYEMMLDIKKKELLETADPEQLEEIVQMDAIVTNMELQKQNLEAALAAGWIARDALWKAEKEQLLLSDWLILEVVSNAVTPGREKYGQVDRAQEKFEVLQKALDEFNDVLRKVMLHPAWKIQMELIIRLKDNLYYGILDYQVAKEYVNDMEKHLADIREKLLQIMDKLELMLQENEKTRVAKRQQRADLIRQF